MTYVRGALVIASALILTAHLNPVAAQAVQCITNGHLTPCPAPSAAPNSVAKESAPGVSLAMSDPIKKLDTPIAGSLEDAIAAYRSGDYATALRLFLPLADQGRASAQYGLGVMYATGHGAPQSYAEALKWYRLAADQGHTSAQYNLGFMFTQGQGVPKNYAEAAKLYRLAADQGDAEAQVNLGAMLKRPGCAAELC